MIFFLLLPKQENTKAHCSPPPPQQNPTHLSFLKGRRIFRSRRNHIGNPIAQFRCIPRIPLRHLLREFLVRLFRCILRFRQLLRYDQLWNVHVVLQQIRDNHFRVVCCTLWISVDEQLLEAGVDHIHHQCAVVSAHSFDALAVHFVVFVWASEVQPGVTFFVDQQVGEIHLWKNFNRCCIETEAIIKTFCFFPNKPSQIPAWLVWWTWHWSIRLLLCPIPCFFPRFLLGNWPSQNRCHRKLLLRPFRSHLPLCSDAPLPVWFAQSYSYRML